ncbi:hypothetical protein SQ11_03665 [Nitrosospira sp. NpAV]|nr:hypothetical protein SQ11_03665 [Nitrosospira sp. NpAV]
MHLPHENCIRLQLRYTGAGFSKTLAFIAVVWNFGKGDQEMKEEEKDKEPEDGNDGLETGKVGRFLFWTLVFSLVGTVVVSATGFRLVL